MIRHGQEPDSVRNIIDLQIVSSPPQFSTANWPNNNVAVRISYHAWHASLLKIGFPVFSILVLALPSVLASCWSWSHLLVLATPLRLLLAFDTSPTSFGPKRYDSSISSLLQQDLVVIPEDDPFSLIRAVEPSASASTYPSISSLRQHKTSQ
jgi:hypothetical protein